MQILFLRPVLVLVITVLSTVDLTYIEDEKAADAAIRKSVNLINKEVRFLSDLATSPLPSGDDTTSTFEDVLAKFTASVNLVKNNQRVVHRMRPKIASSFVLGSLQPTLMSCEDNRLPEIGEVFKKNLMKEITKSENKATSDLYGLFFRVSSLTAAMEATNALLLVSNAADFSLWSREQLRTRKKEIEKAMDIADLSVSGGFSLVVLEGGVEGAGNESGLEEGMKASILSRLGEALSGKEQGMPIALIIGLTVGGFVVLVMLSSSFYVLAKRINNPKLP